MIKNKITNNIISGNYDGIHLYHSDRNTISNNDVLNNGRTGILLENSNANIITDNKEKCAGCNGKVLYGDVVDHILTYCKNEQASLVIIGTHGRKGLEKIMLG